MSRSSASTGSASSCCSHHRIARSPSVAVKSRCPSPIIAGAVIAIFCVANTATADPRAVVMMTNAPYPPLNFCKLLLELNWSPVNIGRRTRDE